MTDERMALIELVEKQADGDLVREMLAFAAGEGDLLQGRFFLVISLGTTKTRREGLAQYREPGMAEGHIGELENVALALSSTD